MRRRYKLAFAALLVSLIACGIVAVWPREPEPTYQGRKLSVWLKDFGSNNPRERLEAANAVREIGPSAMPLLVTWLRPRIEPTWEFRLRLFFLRIPVVHRFLSLPVQRRWEAVAACDALGPAAKSALPELEKLLPAHDSTAALAMADIGPSAVPLLEKAATNASSSVRCYARAALSIVEGRSAEPFASEVRYDFMKRNVKFNLKLIEEAFVEYRAQHPEEFTNSPAVWPEQSSGIPTNSPSRIISGPAKELE